MKLKLAILTPIFILLLSAASLTNVFAQINVEISGNGAGTSNNVNVDQQDSTVIEQNNEANINNNVNADCNTGGNSASGNTGGNANVSTGNCDVNVNVQNNVNRNCIGANCLPGSPGSPGTPGTPGNGGGGSSSGGGGGSSAGGGNGGPGTLGETGTTENLAMLTGGMGVILLGLWFARKSFVEAL